MSTTAGGSGSFSTWRATSKPVACGLVLIALGITELVVNLPLLTIVTAALLIASGLFITVSSCWARYSQTHMGRAGQQARPSQSARN